MRYKLWWTHPHRDEEGRNLPSLLSLFRIVCFVCQASMMRTLGKASNVRSNSNVFGERVKYKLRSKAMKEKRREDRREEKRREEKRREEKRRWRWWTAEPCSSDRESGEGCPERLWVRTSTARWAKRTTPLSRRLKSLRRAGLTRKAPRWASVAIAVTTLWDHPWSSLRFVRCPSWFLCSRLLLLMDVVSRFVVLCCCLMFVVRCLKLSYAVVLCCLLFVVVIRNNAIPDAEDELYPTLPITWFAESSIKRSVFNKQRTTRLRDASKGTSESLIGILLLSFVRPVIFHH